MACSEPGAAIVLERGPRTKRHVVFQEDGSNIYIRRILEGMGVLPPADEAAQQLPLEDAG